MLIQGLIGMYFNAAVVKCFMYVTKTIANLTTYSRKPGDYIFCHCPNQNNTSLHCYSLYAQQKTAETITNKATKTFVKKSSLTKIIIDWGGLFHDINVKNNGAIVIPWFSTLCG